MTTIEHNGESFDVYADGCLIDPIKWNLNWVDYAKKAEGISEVSDEHQKVIDTLRDYYEKNGVSPYVRIFSKVTGFPLKRIYEMFPSGPGKGACKMAGLPKPPEGC